MGIQALEERTCGLIPRSNISSGQGTGDIDSQIKSLPNGAEMCVSMRRTLRVHEREGLPLEDLSLIPDASLYLTTTLI
jgi:hypothetical protein